MSRQWTRRLHSAVNSIPPLAPASVATPAPPSTATATAATAPVSPPVTHPFSPRLTYDVPASLPRSYYLGHHHAGLRQIATRLQSTGLVLECRDFRLPLTSWNPLLERTLAGTRRIIVYTKSDLGADTPPQGGGGVKRALKEMHASRPGETPVFIGKGKSKKELLKEIREVAIDYDSITGLRTFVVGMPNVGKSTLLNSLRKEGMHAKAKVAATGNHPGVTRKLSTPVRILGGKDDPDQSLGEGVFIIDTPGVFMPYVSDGESMLKLALVHGVKDNLIPHEIVADYLLYKLNQWDPALYAKYCAPTNDVSEFLGGVARRTGKREKTRSGFEMQAAMWIVAQWRNGFLGKYVVDDVNPETVEAKKVELGTTTLSMNQARKKEKESRKRKAEEKRRGG